MEDVETLIFTLVDGDVTAVTVAVDEGVFGPASFIRADAAASDHLLHINVTRQVVVFLCQIQLAGYHLPSEAHKDQQKGGRAFVSRIPISPESRVLGPISMKSHISVALLKAVFLFVLAQHTNPVVKAHRAVGARVRACAEKPNGGGSGLEEASRGCLIHAANAIEFYREQGTSYGALHFYPKVRTSGSFVFTPKRRSFTESLSMFCSHLL